MHPGRRLLTGLLRPVLHYASRSRLPQTSGTRMLPGLSAPVTIRRDSWGIPHIRAAGRSDLFFAQGFVHAQDRLWQMEINRRAAAGRLAEIVGAQGLPTDRLARTLGFSRLAAAAWPSLPPTVRADVEAYTAGINGFLNGPGGRPVEFSLLRHTPEPWTPLDTVAFARLELWTLALGAAGELVRAQLNARVGAQAAAELDPSADGSPPIPLPPTIRYAQLRESETLPAANGPFIHRGADGAGKGSNGWVIAAAHAAADHALLCNDMHLPLATPSLWYYNHLRADEGLHVTGVSQPGLPYVLIGHNEHIAWGATLAFTDVEDLFVEQLHPDGSGRYRFRDEWRQGMVYNERIDVRGQSPHYERVVTTHHGPLVSTVLADESAPGSTRALALASTALVAENSFSGFALLNEAGDWPSFVTAAQAIAVPPLNLLYADRQNNIGHYVTGRVPIRAQGRGLTPVPGWSGDFEWTGTVPPDELPQAFNPPSGRFVSCNQRPADDSSAHFLGAIWMSGNRARRVDDLLAAKPRLSVEDCARVQQDLYCTPAVEIGRLVARFEFGDADARLAQSLLVEWNGWLSSSAVGGAVYAVFLRELAQALLEPALGRPLLASLLGLGVHETLAPTNEFFGHWADTVIELLQAERSVWIAGRLGREALVERALGAAVRTLRAKHGADPGGWQWGNLHQIRFRHLLARNPVFDAIFSLGPYPIGGDVDTVRQSSVRPGDAFDCNAMSVSYRQIVDVGDWERSRAMLVPGQSGHLASPHYSDLITPWLEGEYFPMHWSEEAVAGAARETLTLRP